MLASMPLLRPAGRPRRQRARQGGPPKAKEALTLRCGFRRERNLARNPQHAEQPVPVAMARGYPFSRRDRQPPALSRISDKGVCARCSLLRRPEVDGAHLILTEN